MEDTNTEVTVECDVCGQAHFWVYRMSSQVATRNVCQTCYDTNPRYYCLYVLSQYWPSDFLEVA